jgi:hypothetical protein
MCPCAWKSWCDCDRKPRSDLKNAPDLDLNTAKPDSYNCYGNAIGKQIFTNPTGYETGESTETTYLRVVEDLGSSNIRRLKGVDDSIGSDEFKVAMKCGWLDYHFIRQDSSGVWVSKSGEASWRTVPESRVTANTWSFGLYNKETIYFAVKRRWSE